MLSEDWPHGKRRKLEQHVLWHWWSVWVLAMVGTTPIQLMINIQLRVCSKRQSINYQWCCMSFLLKSMFWVLKILIRELNFQVVADNKKNKKSSLRNKGGMYVGSEIYIPIPCFLGWWKNLHFLVTQCFVIFIPTLESFICTTVMHRKKLRSAVIPADFTNALSKSNMQVSQLLKLWTLREMRVEDTKSVANILLQQCNIETRWLIQRFSDPRVSIYFEVL